MLMTIPSKSTLLGLILLILTLNHEAEAQQQDPSQLAISDFDGGIFSWRRSPFVHYLASFVPWNLYVFPGVQRFEVKLINSLFFKFPFLKKNNKWTASPIVNYGKVRGYDTGCFTLYYTKNDQCGYRMIATNFLPESTSLVNVRYFLNNAAHKDTLITNDVNLATITIDTTQAVRFLIHGMQEDETDTYMRAIQRAFSLKFPAENIFLVSWDGNYIGSDTKETGVTRWYGQAAANTELVGRIVGNFMRELELAKPGVKTNITQMHCIGFSLGAQICGHIGNWLQRTYGTKLGRISALDAANPLFDDKLTGDYKEDVKVGPSDATFVDAIHTSGAKSVKRGAGDYERYGHVDFYPNGGVQQTGCPQNWLQAAKEYAKSSSANASTSFSCSHSRAPHLYADSIFTDRTTCKFISDQCSNWAAYDKGDCFQDPCADSDSKCTEMGFYSDRTYHPNANGVYYIKTYPQDYTAEQGFCAQLFRVTVTVSSSHTQTKGRLVIRAWPADASKTSRIAYFNDDKEQILPGATKHAIVAAYSEDITNIEVKFYNQKYAGYWNYKYQVKPKDATIRIDSISLTNRGGTKKYTACGVTSGTVINLSGKNFTIAATC